MWALDFQFDETADLRRVKLLNIVDEFTREALAVEAAHSIDADGVTRRAVQISLPRSATTSRATSESPPSMSVLGGVS